jgi:hypothetical protein
MGSGVVKKKKKLSPATSESTAKQRTISTGVDFRSTDICSESEEENFPVYNHLVSFRSDSKQWCSSIDEWLDGVADYWIEA